MNTTPLNTKPTITQLEANELAFLAGVKAEKEAKSQGVAPDDAAALLDAASGGVIIAGITFPPIHAGFMLMMGRVAELAEKRTALGTDMGNMGALGFILKEPTLAWAMLKHADATEAAMLFEETVTEFAMQFTLTEFKALSVWIGSEMERMNSKGEEAGK